MKVQELFEATPQFKTEKWAKSMLAILRKVKKKVSIEAMNGDGEEITKEQARDIKAAFKEAGYKVKRGPDNNADFYIPDLEKDTARGIAFSKDEDFNGYAAFFFDDEYHR